jgi:hypothetical protein
LRLDEQCTPFAGELVKTLGSSAALRGGIAVTGYHDGFLFETVESRVEGSTSDFASNSKRDFAANTHAIRFITESKNSKKDRLFEFAKSVFHVLTIL